MTPAEVAALRQRIQLLEATLADILDPRRWDQQVIVGHGFCGPGAIAGVSATDLDRWLRAAGLDTARFWREAPKR